MLYMLITILSGGYHISLNRTFKGLFEKHFKGLEKTYKYFPFANVQHFVNSFKRSSTGKVYFVVKIYTNFCY